MTLFTPDSPSLLERTRSYFSGTVGNEHGSIGKTCLRLMIAAVAVAAVIVSHNLVESALDHSLDFLGVDDAMKRTSRVSMTVLFFVAIAVLMVREIAHFDREISRAIGLRKGVITRLAIPLVAAIFLFSLLPPHAAKNVVELNTRSVALGT